MTGTLSNPITDIARLAEVGRLCLDHGPDSTLDYIVKEAAHRLGTRWALLGAVLNDTEMFLSTYGLPDLYATVGGVPLDWTFCQYTVVLGGPLVVPDALREKPYRNLVAVTGHGVRRYVGVPLVSSRGLTVGTLCALDPLPGDVTTAHIRTLTELADLAMQVLELNPRL